MRPTASQLPTYKGLRGDILVALKRAQPLSASDLARQLAVSPNAVRHHLKELEAESLITFGREQRGVGAPTYAYRLARAGEALFPQAYEETLTQLLEHVAAKDGRHAAVELFEERYRELTRRVLAELEGADPRERLALVTRLLSEQGYMAEWAAGSGAGGAGGAGEAGEAFRLAEHNCAIRAVAERFPEVCAAEQRFLEDVLGAAVERRAHIPAGCNACEYAITFGTERGES
jgi:DeoR family transcriptional regulator, suf operon transcriptional repressor